MAGDRRGLSGMGDIITEMLSANVFNFLLLIKNYSRPTQLWGMRREV